MKRSFHFLMVGLVLVCLMAGVAGAQSVADAARKARQDKSGQQAKWVFDNDNLPKDQSIADKPAASNAGTAAKSDTAAAPADAGKAAAPKTSDADQKADAKKAEDTYRTKIAAMKTKIDTTAKELDLLEREHKLQAAAFYADAGTRLRDDKNWADKERQFSQDQATKQQQLADLKQQLEDLREEGRKAGVSAAALE